MWTCCRRHSVRQQTTLQQPTTTARPHSRSWRLGGTCSSRRFSIILAASKCSDSVMLHQHYRVIAHHAMRAVWQDSVSLITAVNNCCVAVSVLQEAS